MDKKDPLAQYAHDLRTGGVKPSKVDVKKPAPEVVRAGYFQRNRELIKQICIAVILVLCLSSIAYYIYQQATGGVVPEHREPLFGQAEDVYVEEQREALARITAELASRERVLLAVIDRFFDEQSSFQGRRKLCISFNDKPTQCTTGDIDKAEFIGNLRN